MAKELKFSAYKREVGKRLQNLSDREAKVLYNNRNKNAMGIIAKVLGRELLDGFDFEKELARGGRVDMQAGGVAQQPQPAGFVGGPPENFTDGQTVADDQPMSVPEGTFVINAAAVEFAGSDDIKEMLSNAYAKLKKKVDKSNTRTTLPTEDEIDVAVSRGEVIVPPEVAKIIGYDRLEKINNRGKKEVSRRQKKVAKGGFISS